MSMFLVEAGVDYAENYRVEESLTDDEDDDSLNSLKLIRKQINMHLTRCDSK